MKAILILLLLSVTAHASINPRNAPYNATGNGVTDDSAAIQMAVNYAIAAADEVYLPSGTYLIRSSVQVNGPLTFSGINEEQSIILLGNPSVSGFNVTTSSACHFEKFCIIGQSQGSHGAGITVDPLSVNNESTFYRIRIDHINAGFDFESAAYWKIDSCTVFNWSEDGVIVRDILRIDDGDSSIVNSLFLTTLSGGAAIYQESSSGLRVQNNKMLGGDYGYFMALTASSTACDLLINNNSIEGQRVAGIFLINASNVTFLNAIIDGNEIQGQNNAILVMDTQAAPWLLGLSITGNDINMAPTGGVAMDLNGTSGQAISGNYIRSNGGTTYGILLRQYTQNGATNTNSFVGVMYPYTDIGVNNK